jgi:putative resolvase
VFITVSSTPDTVIPVYLTTNFLINKIKVTPIRVQGLRSNTQINKTSMTKSEALDTLGCSYSTLRRYAAKGLIRTYKYEMYGKRGKLNYWEEDVYAMVGKRITRDHWIVGYVRVGKRFKEDLAQLQSQKNLMRHFCTKRGISLEKVYEDIGASTDFSEANRPEFHQLLRDIMAGKVDAIVIDTKCRLTRVAFEMVEELCKYHGTDIVIMNPVLTDPYYLEEQSEDLTKLIQNAGLDRAISSEKSK